MKRITDLTGNDVIHCPTKEEWIAIRKLNPNDTCGVNTWDFYKENTKPL